MHLSTFFRPAFSFLILPYLVSLAIAIPTAGQGWNTTYKSYDYGVDINTIAKRQADASPIPVTGAALGSARGSIPVRREVRDLQSDNVTWTLYILGLDMMQGMDQSDEQSWYSIAGIHGRPFRPFNTVQARNGNLNNGYCAHVSILFPTWHRPYLALYEQVLYNLIQNIATAWPEGAQRDQYVAAAANFRIPYWDWAMADQGESVMPRSIGGSPSVAANGPRGVQTIRNPLFSYAFEPLSSGDFPDAPFNVYSQTMRNPTRQDGSAQSQNTNVNAQLRASASSFRNRLYNLFTNYHNYTMFSNEGYVPRQTDSIESLHDQIHGLTGSGGHMTYLEYSAFDPIFFLHHAMVDRCFAMWQVLNPDSYVEPRPALLSTFTTSAGEMQDVASPLMPFYRSSAQDDFWTSNDVISTQVFNYVYPETLPPASDDPSALESQVITAINTLYRFPLPQTAPRSRRSVKTMSNLKRDELTPSQAHEWIANIVVAKRALDAPFFIHIFLGEFDDTDTGVANWNTDKALVGTHCVFARASYPSSSGSGDETSQASEEELVSATIPLTSALNSHISTGLLGSLDPSDVSPYLEGSLRYRVSTVDGRRVANGDVEGLKVSVVSSVLDFGGILGAVEDGLRIVEDLIGGVAKNLAVLPTWGPLRDEGIVCGE